jgi:hypothetical protein
MKFLAFDICLVVSSFFIILIKTTRQAGLYRVSRIRISTEQFNWLINLRYGSRESVGSLGASVPDVVGQLHAAGWSRVLCRVPVDLEVHRWAGGCF